MKKQMPVRFFFLFSLVFISLFAFFLNVQAQPDTPGWGCHKQKNYTISANASSIECDTGGTYNLEIIATGTDVKVDVYSGAMDNDVFIISPGNIINDNDPADSNPATDAINVILKITMPSSEGHYTLRIISWDGIDGPGADDMYYLDLVITVSNGGIPPPPPPPPPTPTSSINTSLDLILPILILVSAIALMGFVGMSVKKVRKQPTKKYINSKMKTSVQKRYNNHPTHSSNKNIQERKKMVAGPKNRSHPAHSLNKNVQPRRRIPIPPQNRSRSTSTLNRNVQTRRRIVTTPQNHRSSTSSLNKNVQPRRRMVTTPQNHRSSTSSLNRNIQPKKTYTSQGSRFSSFRSHSASQTDLHKQKNMHKSKSISIINEETCTGCGACLSQCKFNAITIEDKAEINPDICIGCGACVDSCPNNAISIKNL